MLLEMGAVSPFRSIDFYLEEKQSWVITGDEVDAIWAGLPHICDEFSSPDKTQNCFPLAWKC